MNGREKQTKRNERDKLTETFDVNDDDIRSKKKEWHDPKQSISDVESRLVSS